MSYTLHKDYPAKAISYGSSRSSSRIKYLVFHYTANKTSKAANEAKYYMNTNTKAAGAHYFIDDSTVYQSIDDLKVAWAVGGSVYTDISETGGAKMHGLVNNYNSISIEMCSTNGVITEATQSNAISFARTLMRKYGIPASNCYRHFDVTGKHCPGWTGWWGSDNSKWDAFKKKLSTTESATKKYYSGTFPTLPDCGYFKKGDTGEQVVLLQKLLNWYGDYGLAEDGSLGSATVSAIKKFQTATKLTADGYFGKASLAKAKTIKK